MMETPKKSDTIFALSSGQGRAGVAVVRVSGPEAHPILRKMTKGRFPSFRRASLRTLFTHSGEKIDQALVLVFKGPASFTGEDMVEFHIHGSAAVLEILLQTFANLGLRQARAGEFTRRGFESGKMDLTEAEGIADLIDAQSGAQRQQSLKQMAGGLRQLYESWRSDLIDCLALIDGELDFPDEDDVPSHLSHSARPKLDALRQRLENAVSQSHIGEKTRHGLEVVILGAPNAGKSSLINGLTKKNVAIVSNIEGTTRDIIGVDMEIGGQIARLSDTAGIRQSTDAIEQEGVRRAQEKIKSADIRLLLVDGTNPTLPQGIVDTDTKIDIVIVSKRDCMGKGDYEEIDENLRTDPVVIYSELSPKQVFAANLYEQQDVKRIYKRLESQIENRFALTESPSLTRARHRKCVEHALKSVENALKCLEHTPELAGAEIRSALHALKELAGETDIEAVLDRVFSSFCIGK